MRVGSPVKHLRAARAVGAHMSSAIAHYQARSASNGSGAQVSRLSAHQACGPHMACLIVVQRASVVADGKKLWMVAAHALFPPGGGA